MLECSPGQRENNDKFRLGKTTYKGNLRLGFFPYFLQDKLNVIYEYMFHQPEYPFKIEAVLSRIGNFWV